MSAWLSRVFGRKNYYMACVTLFTIASFFCGIAPSFNVMLMARVLQGIGGGGLGPVEQSILVDTFPPAKRASAFALYTIAIVTAPAIGPVLGGPGIQQPPLPMSPCRTSQAGWAARSMRSRGF
jgi:DHA2 family multidrug resistance protein